MAAKKKTKLYSKPTEELTPGDKKMLTAGLPPGYTLESFRALTPIQRYRARYPEKSKEINKASEAKRGPRKNYQEFVDKMLTRIAFENLLNRAVKNIILDKPEQSYICLYQVADMVGLMESKLMQAVDRGVLARPLVRNGLWAYPPDYVACLVVAIEMFATPRTNQEQSRVDWGAVKDFLHQSAEEGGWVDFSHKATEAPTKGAKAHKAKWVVPKKSKRPKASRNTG
jgi:hypothetical protein